MPRTKVIINPYSGRGTGLRMQAQVETALREANVEYDIFRTEGPGHGLDLARNARDEGYAVVAAAGGDGTISEVMNGLLLSTPENQVGGRLGLLPLGTGNDFADMVGASRRLSEAAWAIARGLTRRIDIGIAHVQSPDKLVRRYFDNNMGIGLEAAATLESYKIKRLSGTTLYLTAALRTIAKMVAPMMHITWESFDGGRGERDKETLLVTVGNSRRTGGGFFLTPDALMNDGFLDVGIADRVSAPVVLPLLARALWGKHTTHRAVTMLRVRQMTVVIPEGAPVQLDGEVVAERAQRIEIGVLPAKLEVIV
jgi:YegS/Rv2252/BmrU family lipid kinase